MKLLKSFLILFIAISITSCSSSDDDNSIELTAQSFVGVYALTDYESDVTESATSSTGKESILSETENEGSVYNTVITLNTDGTYTIDGTFLQTSEIDGDQNNEIETIITLETSGTYVLNITSRTITFTEAIIADADGSGFITGEYVIEDLNENELELKQTNTIAAAAGTNKIVTVTEISLTRN
ncbi:hypothetical protein [Polaribacter sp. NJDZ03]|uniref:hypothetical protein n=1 Tax=Polaribacter sp. NJDZ03 TaxID=2855841 RepID=UPI001C4A62D9|nr:hypothetical protein [Polaribacter sp. NJDZ03]